MDLTLSKSDGIETSRQILEMARQMKPNSENQLKFQEPIIIAYTSHPEKVKQECKKIGISRVTHKPMQESKVGQLLEKYFFKKKTATKEAKIDKT